VCFLGGRDPDGSRFVVFRYYGAHSQGSIQVNLSSLELGTTWHHDLGYSYSIFDNTANRNSTAMEVSTSSCECNSFKWYIVG
jgi:hypothetical protein